jgi:hypothetical protein
MSTEPTRPASCKTLTIRTPNDREYRVGEIRAITNLNS